MKKSKVSKKRRFTSIMALIVVTILLLSMIIPVIVRGETPGISIKAELGISGKYRLDINTPVKVFLENTGDHFVGELQIRQNISDTMEYSRYDVYAQSVELPPNSSKVYEMEIPIRNIVRGLDINLTDINGNNAGKHTANAYPVEPGSVLVGVLSDSPNSLKYLRGLPLNEYMYDKETNDIADNLVTLNEFPESTSALKLFHMLIINDYDTGVITSQGKKMLREWVEEGGTLVVGTGHNFQKVMKGLDFIDAKVLSTLETEVPGYAENLPNPLTLNVMDVPGGSFKEGLILSYYIEQGFGTVILHGFDLGVEPVPYIFGQSNQFLTNDYLTYIKRDTYRGLNREDFLTRYINNLPSLNDDTIIVSFVILGVWIVFIGPILYIILKKKDIREKGFTIIPILALLTTGLIYLLGSNGMYKKAIVNTFSSVNVNDSGVANVVQVSGVFSPYADDIKVEFNKELPISLPNQMYYDMDYRTYSDAKEKDVKKILMGTKPSITFYDKESWGISVFSSKYTSDMGRLNMDLTLDGNVLKGKITNDSKMDFDEIIIEFAGLYVKLADKLIQGDSAEVKLPLDFEDESYETYIQISKIFNTVSSVSIPNHDRRENYLKYDLMQMEFEFNLKNAYLTTKPQIQNQKPSDTPSENKLYYVSETVKDSLPAKITAFSKSKLNDAEMRVNGDFCNELYTNVFNQEINLKLGSEEKIEMHSGLLGVNTIETENSIEINNDGFYMYDEGQVTLTWRIPSGTKPTNFSFKTYSANIYEILNVTTGEFETLNLVSYENNAQNYFDDEGKISLRIIDIKQGEYITLPRIKVSLNIVK